MQREVSFWKFILFETPNRLRPQYACLVQHHSLFEIRSVMYLSAFKLCQTMPNLSISHIIKLEYLSHNPDLSIFRYHNLPTSI
jgi:hypothetical protein